MFKACYRYPKCKYFSTELIGESFLRKKYFCSLGQYKFTFNWKDLPNKCKAKNLTIMGR